MREILFKAKRLDNGECAEGYLYRLHESLNPFIMLRNRHGEAYEVDPSTVCQYTGLTDKNGKKVFENDKMIFYAYGKNYCGFVEFINGSFGVNCNVAEPFLDDAISKHKAIVIGNIHDGEGGQCE